MKTALKRSTAMAAPAIVRAKNHAMNREDYINDIATNPAKYRRRDGEVKTAELAVQVKSIAEAMAKRDKEIAAAVEKASSEVKETGKIAASTVEELKKISELANGLSTRMLDVEQKAAAIGEQTTKQRQSQKSLGQIVAEDEKVKAWQKARGGTVRLEMRAITSNTTGAGGAGDLVQPTRVPEIIRPEDRQLTIRDLLSQSRTNSNAIEYVRETGYTNAAAPVAETTQKPESTLEFNLATVPVRTIAHWVHASKQILDDAPMLQSYIDNRLRFGLAIVEENQILAGDGTGQNMLGLIPEAIPYNRPTTGTKIDVIRRSITQVRLSEYRADAVVMHPADWEEIELTKTTEGAYVWGSPSGLLVPRIWGLRVVDTTAIAEDHFLTGAFKLAATYFDREDAAVQISDQDRDNFITNMITIRAEERGAVVVWRPEALVYGDYSANSDGGN